MTAAIARKLLYSYHQIPGQDLLEYAENLEAIYKTNIKLDLNISIATSSILTDNTKETCKDKTRALPDCNNSDTLAKYLA